jgi:hypothetical protein
MYRLLYIARDKWRVLAAGTVLAIAAMAAVLPSHGTTDNYYTKESLSDPAYTDATIASLQVGAITFRVPRHYLFSIIEKEQPQDSILLLALGPELRSRTEETKNIGWLNHSQRVQKFGYDPFVTILMRDAARFIPFEKAVESRTIGNAAVRSGTTDDGLEKYEVGPRSYQLFREIAVERVGIEPATLIECMPNTPAPRCEMIFRHRSLQVHTNYPMNHGRIKSWRAFKAAVIEKIDSFVEVR